MSFQEQLASLPTETKVFKDFEERSKALKDKELEQVASESFQLGHIAALQAAARVGIAADLQVEVLEEQIADLLVDNYELKSGTNGGAQ